MQGSIQLVWSLRMHFGAIFTQKTGHNSVENYCIGKKITLCFRLHIKYKLFLKYQDNARFPSVCLVPENSFLNYSYSKKRP